MAVVKPVMKVIKTLQTLERHSMKSKKPCRKAINAADMVFLMSETTFFREILATRF